MTSQPAAEDRDPAEVIAEDAVAAYLEAHPDFFERRPDLAAGLRVPHVSGGAVSLIEHQVAILRGQLQIERRRLAHLIARAQDFEALSARLHSLSLRLIAAGDLEQVEAVLREVLSREFNAEVVSLKLFAVGESDTSDSDPAVTAFLGFVDREHSLCGPLDPERKAVLFSHDCGPVHSAALIPVRAHGHCGVLAIGSSDPGRFGADMGTDLLDRLGEIVGQKLRVLQETDG
jgi:uncharacterized protein YigA (DUF484 family)